MAHHLFEGAELADNYAKYRPTCPLTVFEHIISFMKARGCSFELALDIGCGSGQSTRPLAKYFTKVTGVDISPAQIKYAKLGETLANVDYSVGSDTTMPVAPSSVDLITAAQANHWFDPIEKFYDEARRVLKPNGCLVIYTYGIPTFKYDDNAQQLDAIFSEFRKLWLDDEHDYHAQRTKIVEERYENFSLPFAQSSRWEDEMTVHMTLSQFIGFISSWGIYQKYKEKNPDGAFLDTLWKRLRQAIANEVDAAPNENTLIKVTMPIFVLIGQK